jgi:nicotinate-nucleotide pyrophosphorylase (carboxylating)
VSESQIDPHFWSEPKVVEASLRWIDAALREDRAHDDVTSLALLGDRPERAVASVTAVEAGVLCGAEVAARVFQRLDPSVEVVTAATDGRSVASGEEVLDVRGSAVSLLAAERTALNILGHLSGIATTTARWVARAGDIRVLDTRKTFPGARLFQRRAVAAGGGVNHRFDLADFPLVKENHRDLFGGGGPRDIPAIVARLREAAPGVPLQVEVEDPASFRAALKCGVERVLIDNRTPEEIAEWIGDAERAGLTVDRSGLEASGGITGETIAAYAGSGVGRVSLGALTHSVRALDLSLHMRWE